MPKKSAKKKTIKNKNDVNSIEKLLNRQTVVILDAVDKKLQKTESNIDKKLQKTEARINEKFGKLPEIFATREEVATKDDIEDLKKDFNNLQTAVDSYAKKSDAYFQEMLLLVNKVDRQERWIHLIAEKVGVQLKY